MQLTLLDITQDILSDMDSDEVNSINDTVEAMQVAQIVKSTYFLMCSNRNWGDQKGLITLDHIGDLARPNYLRLPDNVKELTSIEYNIRKEDNTGPLEDYRKLQYRYPDEFLRICQSRPRNGQDWLEIQDFGGAKLFIKDNAPPSYWTSFDDKYLVTDSYDKDVDDTLQASKTRALVVSMPGWEMRDDFIPKLPIEAYAALQAEAKSTAFLVLKQMENAKAESASQKQQRWLARKNSTAKNGVRYAAYGRGRRK